MDEAIAEELREFVSRVAAEENLHITDAYLFGSRARDDYREESDVDLLVVSPDFAPEPSYLRAKPFYLAWEYPPDIELKCYTPAEFDKLCESVSIARTAREEGIAVA